MSMNLGTSDLITLAAFLASVGINALIVVNGYGKLQQQVADLRKSREENDDTQATILQKIQAFELEASRKFATIETLSQLRVEIVGAMNRLTDRVDRVLDNHLQDRSFRGPSTGK